MEEWGEGECGVAQRPARSWVPNVTENDEKKKKNNLHKGRVGNGRGNIQVKVHNGGQTCRSPPLYLIEAFPQAHRHARASGHGRGRRAIGFDKGRNRCCWPLSKGNVGREVGKLGSSETRRNWRAWVRILQDSTGGSDHGKRGEAKEPREKNQSPNPHETSGQEEEEGGKRVKMLRELKAYRGGRESS